MKRRIKILGVQTHFKIKVDRTTGVTHSYMGAVDYYRVVQQLKYLPKDKFEVDIVYKVLGPNEKFQTADELTKYYDFMFVSYMDTVQFYIELRVNGINNGMKMILDLDDNLWKVDPTHPFYKGDFEPGSEKNFNRSAMILDADAVTTTNSYLRYQIVENTKRPIKDIHILPNFIDLTLFDYKKIPPKPNKDEIQIGYLGGSSHYPDINKVEFVQAVKKIMEKYPNVTLKTTFYMPQLKALFGNRYKYSLGRHNYFRYVEELWPKMCSESDILIAPLSWSPYSRSKSFIKAEEYGAARKPVILEDIDPYREFSGLNPEDRGIYLASTTQDWVKYFSMLIESEDLRKKNGMKLYKYVKDNWQIQDPRNIKLISDFFESLFKKKA